MGLIQVLSRLQPHLREQLLKAGLKQESKVYIRKALQGAMLFSVGFFVFTLMVSYRLTEEFVTSLFISIGTGVVVFAGFYLFFMNAVTVYIRRRQRELEREVLFAGRYLLVKLQAGTPTFTALTDAAHSKGVVGSFFREIVNDVETGMPIEKALEKHAQLCPSRNFAMILNQVNNALRSGSEVTHALSYLLEEITDDQTIAIEKYGKKLNSLTLFYMMAGVVLPALGVSFFAIASGFLGIKLERIHLYFVAFLMLMVQFYFLTIFKTIRPPVSV